MMWPCVGLNCDCGLSCLAHANLPILLKGGTAFLTQSSPSFVALKIFPWPNSTHKLERRDDSSTSSRKLVHTCQQVRPFLQGQFGPDQ